MSHPSPLLVVLQVGDRRFTTHKDTLTDGSAFFESKLSGRWDLEPGEDGSFFLDEEPEVFEHILRYLRRGIYPLLYDRVKGFDYAMYIRVLKSAEFLIIPALGSWIKNQRYLQAVKITRSTRIYEQDAGAPIHETTLANTTRTCSPTWQMIKVFVCPRGISNHRGDKKRCGRACAAAQGDQEDEFEDEMVCEIMEVTEKVDFDCEHSADPRMTSKSPKEVIAKPSACMTEIDISITRFPPSNFEWLGYLFLPLQKRSPMPASPFLRDYCQTHLRDYWRTNTHTDPESHPLSTPAMASTICLHPTLHPLALSCNVTPCTTSNSPSPSTPTPKPTSMQTLAQSPLLALPPELRLKIYTLALALTLPATPGQYPTTYHLTNPCLTHVIPGLPLLLTNRQIYSEARLLPYTSNNYGFIKWYGSSVYNCKRWLGKLEPWQRRVVRGLDVWVAGREVVEVWRREEGWCALVGLLEVRPAAEGGEEAGDVVDKGVLIRAHVREDDVWGVERVRDALEGCLRHSPDEEDTSVAAADGRKETEQKKASRVRLEIVIEDMGLAKDVKKKKPEPVEELTVMSGWAYGLQDEIW